MFPTDQVIEDIRSIKVDLEAAKVSKIDPDGLILDPCIELCNALLKWFNTKSIPQSKS